MKRIIFGLLICGLLWNPSFVLSAEGMGNSAVATEETGNSAVTIEKTEYLQTTAEGTGSEFLTIQENSLFAQGAVLMDGVSGRILYGKNPDLQLAMASTTKIMTCIMALEMGNMDDIVTVSGYAAAQPKVKLYLTNGDQVRLGDLLYSLMLESHNDTAVAVAEHIGAKLLGMADDLDSVKARTDAQSKEAVQAFIGCMNEKARELQCYNTWFITPSGLDATQTFSDEEGVEMERFHSTTAAELARIMSYCIMQSPKKEEFLKITGTYSYTFSNVECTRSFSCQNHNAFLNMMDGALSGKTGYTGQAGYCYVGALERDGRYYVVALLNTGAYGSGNKSNKWKDTRKLMEYGLEHYDNQTVYAGNTITEPVLVENAKPKPGAYFDQTLIPTEVSGVQPIQMLLADWEEVRVTVEQEYCLAAPVTEGESVGKVEVLVNDTLLQQFDIICTESMEAKTFQDTINYIVNLFLL